jgi:hypothetical protein
MEETSKTKLAPEQGPAAYLNWLAALKGEPLLCTYEYPLYTDAHIVAEVQHGPYYFLNAVSMPQAGVRPAVILRYDWHWEFPYPDWSRTDSDRYHGGTPPDEVAALASLAMGVRLKAGDSTREFRPGSDPKGTPRAWATRPAPPLSLGRLVHRWVLPQAAEGEHSLELLQPLGIVPELSPMAALTLVRSARLYQDALWLAESQPLLAWLLLVSALETAAVYWRSNPEDALARFRTENSELYEALFKLDPAIPSRVADAFKNSFGVTKKFIDFVISFRPPEPKNRPGWTTVAMDWSNASLTKILRTVYGYRSKALHEGRPFPAPMCEPALVGSGWAAPAEKPSGSSSMSGGTWLEKDLPILLHTFELITRETLLNWWRARAPQEEQTIASASDAPVIQGVK